MNHSRAGLHFYGTWRACCLCWRTRSPPWRGERPPRPRWSRGWDGRWWGCRPRYHPTRATPAPVRHPPYMHSWTSSERTYVREKGVVSLILERWLRRCGNYWRCSTSSGSIRITVIKTLNQKWERGPEQGNTNLKEKAEKEPTKPVLQYWMAAGSANVCNRYCSVRLVFRIRIRMDPGFFADLDPNFKNPDPDPSVFCFSYF